MSVVDTTKPVITLLGNATETVEAKTILHRCVGASASDTLDGNLTGSVTIVSTVNTDVVGSYSVTYSVSDANGKAADSVTRTVSVVDTTKPVITLLGSATETVEAKGTYTDAGATASDTLDGNLTGSVTSVSTVNTDVVGSYSVTYSVSDANGKAADSVTRTVSVVDTTKPVITLLGNATVQQEALIEFNDPGVTVIDSIDGNLDATVTGSVDVNTVGTYILKYGATDTSGNIAIEVQRIVTVGDTGAPVILLVGDILVTHEAKTTYEDAGATSERHLNWT